MSPTTVATEPAVDSTAVATPAAGPVSPISLLAHDHVPGQILVRPAVQAVANLLREAFDARIVDRIEALDILVVEVNDEEGALMFLSGVPDVEVLQPNLRYHAIEAAMQQAPGVGPRREAAAIVPRQPDDPLLGDQWHLALIQAPSAWAVSRGDGATIAVLDTGVDCGHRDLRGKCAAGFDFVNGDGDARDDHGHGTHVAGIAAAATDNADGGAGVGWSARVMPVKVLDDLGTGDDVSIAKGLLFAADEGAGVVNMSLGGSGRSRVLEDAVAEVHRRGLVVVAAAGNEDSDAPAFPAAYPGVIAIAATDRSDERAGFSNHADYVDLAAPGVGILSTVPGDDFDELSGTSMAAPVVAGVAALVLAASPGLAPDAVEDRLARTAVDLGAPGRDPFFGAGRVNAGRALEGIGEVPASPTATASPPTTAPPTPTPVSTPEPTDHRPPSTAAPVETPLSTPVASPSATPAGTVLPTAIPASTPYATAVPYPGPYPGPVTAVPTATAYLMPPPTPTPYDDPLRPKPGVCEILHQMGVPQVDIDLAVAHPALVYGWGLPANPSLPPSAHNPPRRWLTMRDTGQPYHRLFNGLQYKAGCP